MKKGVVVLKTIAIQLCFLCLQLIFLHSASAETAAERAKVASILFNGKATYQDYNVWGACPVVNGQNWCTIQKYGYVGGHSGIDIQTKTKSKEDTFYSVSTGVVIAAGTDTYKTLAVYDSSRNITVIYLHASAVNVGVGTTISAIGIPLGKQGDSGASGAIHVHLEARSGRQTSATAGGKPNTIDPVATALSYINKIATPTVTLMTPLANATGVSPTNVAFSWISQNATNHRIVISTTSNFSGFVDTGDGSSYCSNAATCYTTTTSSSTSYTKTLSAGTTYYWKVRASGSGGNAWSSAWNFTTASATTKPVAPTGLSASAAGTSITFRWNDVSSNESGFRVYRWNGSTWASQAATAANATSYTNTGLSSNTTYYYTVCSYNSAGESCASSYASATTGSSGSVPGSVSVNPSSGSWTSSQNIAVTSAGATTIYYTMVNTYDGSTPYDPSSPSQSNYNGTLSGPSATFSLYGSSGQLKKSKLRFVGCNNYGCGSVSGVYSYSIDQRSTMSKPAAPGSQSAAATSSSSIILRWSDLANNESGFRPYRWNGSSWSSLGNVSANSTSYVNSGLSANTTYYYTVCSYNSAGESCPSNYVSATTSSGSSGSSWDGKSPSGTVCEQDAVTVAYNSNSYGKVELRWSNTCKTNWTRVVPNSSSYSTYGKIRRTSDGRSYTTSGTGSRFTAMVYAPTVQACASGSINGYSLSEVCR